MENTRLKISLYTTLVELKHQYILNQPEELTIEQKRARVAPLVEACNAVLGCQMSDFYPND